MNFYKKIIISSTFISTIIFSMHISLCDLETLYLKFETETLPRLVEPAAVLRTLSPDPERYLKGYRKHHYNNCYHIILSWLSNRVKIYIYICILFGYFCSLNTQASSNNRLIVNTYLKYWLVKYSPIGFQYQLVTTKGVHRQCWDLSG